MRNLQGFTMIGPIWTPYLDRAKEALIKVLDAPLQI
jgi:hypothetical protein